MEISFTQTVYIDEDDIENILSKDSRITREALASGLKKWLQENFEYAVNDGVLELRKYYDQIVKVALEELE